MNVAFADGKKREKVEVATKLWRNANQKMVQRRFKKLLLKSMIISASGLEATPEVKQDLLQANCIGEFVLNDFLEKGIKASDVPFYNAIKKCRLKSFSSLKIKKICKVKEKAITISAERGIIANLLVVGEKRDTVSMRDLLTYSLGPIPWSLALPDGGLVKTI